MSVSPKLQSTLSSITNGSESFNFTYDGTLLTSITQQGILNQTLGFGYDSDFRASSFTYAGQTVNYTYDKDGLLTRSGDFTLTRDITNGLTTQISDGNYTITQNYNQFGELKKQKSPSFTLKLKRTEGRIAQKRETVTTLVPKKKKGFKKKKTKTVYHYAYDHRDRLTEVRKGKNGEEIVEQYRYDSNGNRAWANVYGVISEGSYTLDDNLIVYGNNTYRYDDDGYLIEKTTPEGVTTYTYGTMGELREVVTPSKTITYQHNANNQRVAKLIDGQVVEKYLWANLTTLLAVYDANDNLIQRFEYADQRMPVVMSMNGQKFYLHYDQVGSLRAVSDSNQNAIKEVVYDTYGNILSDSNESFRVPFGFAGGLYDSDTKLTRFGYRDYDAYAGKWTAKDPIGFRGGDSNLYGYVLNDPINFIDPSGLYQMCHRDVQLPIPYARHCYVKFGDGSTSSFGPDGVGSDPVPDAEETICTPPKDDKKDNCIKKAMKKCKGPNYGFTKFNCCHCVEQALKECGIVLPVSVWPNWPINPGPQPGEPGYTQTPIYDPSLGG